MNVTSAGKGGHLACPFPVSHGGRHGEERLESGAVPRFPAIEGEEGRQRVEEFKVKGYGENAEHDKKTDGVRVIDLRPRWKQGPLGARLPFLMPFGSYKRLPLDQVPPDYFDWLATIRDLDPSMPEAVTKFRLLKTSGVITTAPSNGATALGAHPETSPDRLDW